MNRPQTFLYHILRDQPAEETDIQEKQLEKKEQHEGNLEKKQKKEKSKNKKVSFLMCESVPKANFDGLEEET